MSPLPALAARERLLVHVFILAAFTYLFLANSWLGDDAYITFRVVWNFLHGYGPVFNPGERVQAYTHPLWMLVLSAAHGVTREFFFTALAVSYGFAVVAVLCVVRSARSLAGGALAAITLFSSKAFIDYTSSGLEYPLSFLLLALFYVRFCRLGPAEDDPLHRDALSLSRDGMDLSREKSDKVPRQLRVFGLLAGLAFVNRMDSVLLYALPLAWLAFRARRRREHLVPLVTAFAVPVVLWLLFATIYYGFPLPNTYYAKVATGIPSGLLYRQGLAYVLNSIGHDPITLGSVGVAAVLAVRSTVPLQLAALSGLLYVAYTVSVGGDFMSGRFFAMPFLVAVVALVRLLRDWNYRWPAAAGLLLYNVLVPLVPAKTTASYDGAWPWRSQNGVKDERGHYHRLTNIFFFSPFRELPDHTWMREGRSFRSGPDKVTVQGSIGFFGLMAGPDKHIVDRNALSDPLLARLPVSPRLYFEFYVGHYFRDIPEGYLESIASGGNQLTDPMLRDYYDRLRNVTGGSLLSTRRLRNILHLNLGAGKRFAAEYEQRRPIALSIRAANERFTTDAGEKDAGAGVIRSVGRAGYLQMGPGIPMKRGLYRARWIGTVNAPANGPIGFVDVWSGDRHLARREISAADAKPETREIADISFALEEPSNSLEYRLWVNSGASLTLERVELASVQAMTASTHNSFRF